MEKNSKNRLRKIQFIEEPMGEDLLRRELEEALGGWNCVSYYSAGFEDNCNRHNNNNCIDGANRNYCGSHTCSFWV